MVSTPKVQPLPFCGDSPAPGAQDPSKNRGVTPSLGLTSEGIYRKCGQTSKTQRLLESLRQDARSVHLKEGEQHVDDVSSALKRFLRDLPDGLFTRAQRLAWLEASGGSCCLYPALPTLPQDVPILLWTRLAPAPLPTLLLSPLARLYRDGVAGRWMVEESLSLPGFLGMLSPW